MELNQLIYFRSLAKTLQFTEAAREISISQSALSRSISKLEEELGHPLFNRDKKKITLTDTGQRFLMHVERGLEEIEEGREEIRNLDDPDSGIIRLSFIHSLGGHVLPMLISEFKEKHPRARFNLDQNSSAALAKGLMEGKSDLCLGTTMVNMEDLVWSYLYSEELFLTLPADDALAGRSAISLEEIENRPFITLKPNYSLRVQTNQIFSLAALQPKIIFEGDDTNTAASLVGARLGISLLPRIIGAGALHIVQVPVSFPTCKREIGIIWSMSRRLSPAALHFLQFIMDRFKKSGPRELGS